MLGQEVLLLGGAGGGVDPSKYTLEELSAIRGAMWSARYPMPWGPRAGQASNIEALAAIANYNSSADRRAMLRDYRSKGYTHGVIGAWRPGPYSPYHDVYPEVDIPFSAFLDILEEFWLEDVRPVVFIKPDNWSAEQLEQLTPFYSQPRAQKLVRIQVSGGWEPSKDTSNAEWVLWVQWGRRVLPKALACIHMEADFDAPGNNDDFTPGRPGYIGMPEAWNRVAPYLHVYLAQFAGYVFGGSPVPTEEFKMNYVEALNGFVQRFEHGYAGWPTHSAWGYRGIKAVSAEYAAFADFWWDWDERYAKQLGDLAMDAGAYGYLDSGSVTVPVR